MSFIPYAFSSWRRFIRWPAITYITCKINFHVFHFASILYFNRIFSLFHSSKYHNILLLTSDWTKWRHFWHSTSFIQLELFTQSIRFGIIFYQSSIYLTPWYINCWTVEIRKHSWKFWKHHSFGIVLKLTSWKQ